MSLCKPSSAMVVDKHHICLALRRLHNGLGFPSVAPMLKSGERVAKEPNSCFINVITRFEKTELGERHLQASVLRSTRTDFTSDRSRDQYLVKQHRNRPDSLCELQT